jgi:hypothetical protein
MENFGYFLLGSLVTILVSTILYVWAGRELQRETKKLRQLHELTLFAFLNPKADLKPRYDGDGNIIGIIVGLSGRSMGTSSGRATAPDIKPST